MQLISVWANKRCLGGKYFPNDKSSENGVRILEGTKQRFSFYRHMLKLDQTTKDITKEGDHEEKLYNLF